MYLTNVSIVDSINSENQKKKEGCMEFKISISEGKAEEIKSSVLLDLDIQSNEKRERDHEMQSFFIVNDKTNHILGQTDPVFLNQQDANEVLGKIIYAIKAGKKSLTTTIKIKYTFKIE